MMVTPGMFGRLLPVAGMLVAALMLSACASGLVKPGTAYDQISTEIGQAARARPVSPQPAKSEAVERALLAPPPEAVARPAAAPEPRFDLVVSGAPAQQVFMAIVSGTPYSMLVHPEVSGTISVNLKDVTVREALDALRELYGYEYKMQGKRIFIEAVSLRTRIFQVNYLASRRQGITDVRVTSGSISASGSGNPNDPAQSLTGSGTLGTGPGAAGYRPNLDSSRVLTRSDADFWEQLRASLAAIVGSEKGRSVVLNPNTGVVVVRAYPSELREVEAYLRATRVTVERQVMLEAKIVEVALRDGYQAGINWAVFRRTDNSRLSAGQIAPGTILRPDGRLLSGAANTDTTNNTFSDPQLASVPAVDLIAGARNLGGLFGLAFQTSNFAAILQFLETQGNVQVLSSPRIATLNNQKAVLKVGTDEFYVTNVSTSTVATGNTSTTSPTITVQPFFSGIALDVTPQIDEDGRIMLHVHPSVSKVAEKVKNLNLGDLGTFTLPLASSDINESDTIVRVPDGSIVAIGGLMRQEQADDRSQIPTFGDLPVVGPLFRQSNRGYVKSELVILIKPTVISDDTGWQRDLREVEERMPAYDPRRLVPPPRTE